VEPLGESGFKLDGEPVKIIVFEDAKEGEIVKICTGNHSLGISAEYAWINYKHPGYDITKQRLYKMKLNGQDVRCDILSIEKGRSKINIFFDISDFFDNPVDGYEVEDENDK